MAQVSQLFNVLEYRANCKGCSVDDLAAFACISPVTYYRRRVQPEKFTLSELQGLAQKLGVQIVIAKDGTVTASAEW